MIPVLVENFDLDLKVTVMVGTAKMENIWIFWVKITDKVVPQSCFDLTFNDDFIQISLPFS